MKKVLFICVTMLLICISGKATERNLLLIPYPQQVSIKQGNYNLTDNVKIGADPLFTQELKKLQEVLTEDFGLDRKSTRLNSSHKTESRMPSSA